MEKYKTIEQSIIKKFRPLIWRQFVKAVDEYKLIEENDKIAICISGGKDSMLLAKCMEEFQKHGPLKFELVYLCMNPGYSQKHLEQIINNAATLNLQLDIFNTDIFNIVHDIKDSPCYLCARMRRGYLYSEAKKRGCNKIALGHHFNDVIETVLISMLYGAEFKTMMPKVISKNYEDMELIRPLYLVKEESIVAWAKYNNLEFLQCACRFTENNQNIHELTSKRKEVKQLIKSLRNTYNDIDINIFRSLQNVNLNTIIGYHKDNINYNFLDDYEQKKNKKKGRENGN